MSFRASSKNLIRRDPTTSLRERAAATASRVSKFKATAATAGTAPVPPTNLAQACDQAVTDWNAIQPASQAENWGDEQLDEALDIYDAVFQRAIDEPSRDLADVQAKSRLLLHDLIEHTTGHDPSDEATLTVDERLTRVVLREIIGLSDTAALTDPTDWPNPPPGFMACPADDPQAFVIVREGLRLELERLHRIALAEYARKVGPDATEATRARIRRELRLPLFEAASPNGDAEILALGLDLDAAHARWRAATPAYWAAQERVRQACERAKARGGSVHAANVAAWDAPGIREADDLFETIGGELERISKAIWRTPARTPLGLAVKARATLVMVFVSGQYERDSGLGEDEDLTEQAARALIEACCALAGVDWKGQPIGADEAPAEQPPTTLDADGAWAKAQAAAIDFSAFTILQLHNLFGCYAAAADTWLTCSDEPWLQQNPDSPYLVRNAAGRLVDREQNRAAWIRDGIAGELRRREPATDAERDYRLETLIRFEIMCEGSLRRAPELRAEINEAWGD